MPNACSEGATMKIWDCHIHLRRNSTADELLTGMDQAGITRVSAFSFYAGDTSGKCTPTEPAAARESIDHMAAVQAVDPDRIWGLFWADPRTEGICDLLEYAILEKGLHGIKMIPAQWAPTDEVCFPVYEKMRELGKVIQFHSGILYGFGDSSRFCRPVLYEALINFPGIKFSLAHISWPWVDECLATFGHFRSASGYKDDGKGMWIDTCRGTPDAWREEALRKAVPFVGCKRLMYGTDGVPQGLAQYATEHIKKDTDLLRNVLGVSEEQIEDFFWNAAEAFNS